MLQLERFQLIENILTQKQQASVIELENLLKISKATIYRDLNEMSKLGLLKIVRGGAAKISNAVKNEQPYYEKQSTNADEKKRIADRAFKLVKPSDTIFLDSSTTVMLMCSSLVTMKYIQIITNDVKIASELSGARDVDVITVGGLLRSGYYTLTGFLALNNLKGLRFDTSFLSCDALTLEDGCMITNSEEVPIKKQILSSSANITLLCDHSKFNNTAFASFCSMSQVNRVITGKELSNEIYDKYIEAGIDIIRV